MPTRSLLTLLLACLATWAAVAAPAPKPRPWVTGWIEADPDRDCRFRREGEVLTIEVPRNTTHLLQKGLGLGSAPRLLYEVRGDFVAEVRVRGTFRKAADDCVTTAGLVLVDGGGKFAYLSLSSDTSLSFSTMKGGRLPEEFSVHFTAGKGGRAERGVALRLERKGDKLIRSLKFDGARHWAEVEPEEVRWPAKLKLGVFAASTSSAPFKARFDQFRLTVKGKKRGP